MNERIWDLFKQSDIDIGEDQESNIEKFAELLVKACAEVVRNDLKSFGADERMKHLKKHFGVK